jgi:hypothetical protein
MFAIETSVLKLATAKAAVFVGIGESAIQADLLTKTGSEGVAVT